jgi:hypothetical protein
MAHAISAGIPGRAPVSVGAGGSIRERERAAASSLRIATVLEAGIFGGTAGDYGRGVDDAPAFATMECAIARVSVFSCAAISFVAAFRLLDIGRHVLGDIGIPLAILRSVHTRVRDGGGGLVAGA